MNNETINIENIEIDLETLANAGSYRATLVQTKARREVVEAVIEALDPEDARKLEEYRNQ